MRQVILLLIFMLIKNINCQHITIIATDSNDILRINFNENDFTYKYLKGGYDSVINKSATEYIMATPIVTLNRNCVFILINNFIVSLEELYLIKDFLKDVKSISICRRKNDVSRIFKIYVKKGKFNKIKRLISNK